MLTAEIKIQITLMNKGKFEYDDQDKAYDNAHEDFFNAIFNVKKETKLSKLIENCGFNSEIIQKRLKESSNNNK